MEAGVMPSTAAILREAHRLLSAGWDADFCFRPMGGGLGGFRMLCEYDALEADHFTLEDSLWRAARNLGAEGNLACFTASLPAAELLDHALGAPSVMLGEPCGWGGAVACCWSREPGREKGDVLALVRKACARAARMEVQPEGEAA